MRYLFVTRTAKAGNVSYSNGLITCPCVLMNSAHSLKLNSTLMVQFMLRHCSIMIEGESLRSTMDFKEFAKFIESRDILFTAEVDSFDSSVIVATNVTLEDSTVRK